MNKGEGSFNIGKEEQYEILLNSARFNNTKLGAMRAHDYLNDPKRLVFTLARYKFVSKMLEGKEKVLEIGCGDGFASKIVSQTVDELHLTDFDSRFVDMASELHNETNNISRVFNHNFIECETVDQYDAIYALDVLEHISIENENTFLRNICKSLSIHGICILGMPSIESQKFASSISKEGHINCKTGDGFKVKIEEYFNNTFLFSMNDEMVHTGFNKLAHYLIAVGCGPK